MQPSPGISEPLEWWKYYPTDQLKKIFSQHQMRELLQGSGKEGNIKGWQTCAGANGTYFRLNSEKQTIEVYKYQKLINTIPCNQPKPVGFNPPPEAIKALGATQAVAKASNIIPKNPTGLTIEVRGPVPKGNLPKPPGSSASFTGMPPCPRINAFVGGLVKQLNTSLPHSLQIIMKVAASYDEANGELALPKAVGDGLVTYGIGALAFEGVTLASRNPRVAFYLALAIGAAELAPDLKPHADNFHAQAEHLREKFSHSEELHEDLRDSEAQLKIVAKLQHTLRALNPYRAWNEYQETISASQESYKNYDQLIKLADQKIQAAKEESKDLELKDDSKLDVIVLPYHVKTKTESGKSTTNPNDTGLNTSTTQGKGSGNAGSLPPSGASSKPPASPTPPPALPNANLGGSIAAHVPETAPACLETDLDLASIVKSFQNEVLSQQDHDAMGQLEEAERQLAQNEEAKKKLEAARRDASRVEHIKFAEKGVVEVVGILNRREAAKQEDRAMDDREDALRRSLAAQQSNMEKAINAYVFPVKDTTFGSIRERDSWNMHALAHEYKKASAELSKRLEEYKKTLQEAQAGAKRNGEAWLKLNAAYSDAMRAKGSFFNGLKDFGALVGVAAFIPGLGQVAMAAFAAAGTAITVTTGHFQQKAQGKLGRKLQHHNGTAQETQAIYDQQARAAFAGIQHVEALEQQNREILRHDMNKIPVKDGLEFLNSDLKKLEAKKAELQGGNGKKGKIEEADWKVKEKLEDVEKAQSKVNKLAYKREESTAKAAAGITLHNAQAQWKEAEEEHKLLVAQSGSLDEEISRQKEAIRYAEYLAPQRALYQQALMANEPYLKSEQKPPEEPKLPDDATEAQKKDAWEAYEKAKKAYDDRIFERTAAEQNVLLLKATIDAKMAYYNVERQLVGMGISAARGIVSIIAADNPQHKAISVVNGIETAYQLVNQWRLISISWEAFYKHWQENSSNLRAQWKANNLTGFTTETILVTIPLGQVLFPMIMAAPAIYSLYRTSQHILYGKQYGWTPYIHQQFGHTGAQMMPMWSAELEFQLLSLDKVKRDLKSDFDEQFEKVFRKIEEARAKLIEIKGELGEIGELVLEKIDEVKKTVKEAESNVVSNERTTATIARLQTFNGDSNLDTFFFNTLFPADKKVQCLHDFLRFCSSLLSDMVVFNYTGNKNTDEPAIVLADVRNAPEYYTDIFGKEIDAKHPLPSWVLFEGLLAKFVEQFSRFYPIQANRKDLFSLIETEPVLRGQLQNCFKLIHDYKKRLDQVSNKVLPFLLEKAWRQQANLRAEMAYRSRVVLEKSRRDLGKTIQQEIAHTVEVLDKQELLGNNKFFLYWEFVDRKLIDIAPNWDLPSLYNYKHRVMASSLDLFEAVTDRGPLGIIILGGTGAIAPALAIPALLGVGGYSAYRVGRAMFNVGLAGQKYTGQIDLRKICAFFESVRHSKYQEEISASLQALATKTTATVTFGNVRPDETTLLKLDANRKLVHDPNHDPDALIKLKLDVDKVILGIEFLSTSIQKKDIQKIPAPHSTEKLEFIKEQDIAKLKNDFTAYLKAIAGAAPLEETNPFSKVKQSGNIVPPATKGLICLAFPNALLETLEQRLFPDLHQLRATGAGNLTFAYDVAFETEKLIIAIHFEFRDQQNNLLKYGKNAIARFSGKAVRPFIADLKRAEKPLTPTAHPENPQALTEFLLQAMYAAFAEKECGLPGKGTVELDGKLVAPVEHRFHGCYRLWEGAPDKMIDFDCDTYTFQMGETISSGIGSGLLLPLPPFQPGEDFFKIRRILAATKKGIEDKQEELRNTYSLLHAVVKLISKTEDHALAETLRSNLGLFPPQQLSALFDTWLLPTGNFDPQRINAVATALSNNENTRVEWLKNQYELAIGLEKALLPPSVEIRRQEETPLPGGMRFIPVEASITSLGSVVGLPNLGNSGYINAALQALFSSPSFNRKLQSIQYNSHLTRLQRALLDLQKALHAKDPLKGKLIQLREVLFASEDKGAPPLSGNKDEPNDPAKLLSAVFSALGMPPTDRLQTQSSELIATPDAGIINKAPEGTRFELQAVIDRTPQQGHYTALVKDGTHWIQADDDTLSPCPSEKIESENNYLYFLEKV